MQATKPYPSYLIFPGVVIPISRVLERKREKVDLIIQTVCDYHGISKKALTGPSRKRPRPEIRAICYYFLRINNLGTFIYIGNLFSKDHSTVIQSLSMLNDLMETQPSIKEDVEKLTLIVNEII